MGNFFGTLIGGLAGAAEGFATGGPGAAIAGGMAGLINGAGSPAGLPTIAPGTDPNIGIQQMQDLVYEGFNTAMNAEQLRHQAVMQTQSQQFNEVQDEKSEMMREMNTLREVAMKQREADDKIVKEFIKTAGGE